MLRRDRGGKERPVDPCGADVSREEHGGEPAALRDRRLELGAIYHSHTRTAPYPSQTDINFAAHWPGVEWLIVGLADGADPEVRSYLIDDGQVREVEIAGELAL